MFNCGSLMSVETLIRNCISHGCMVHSFNLKNIGLSRTGGNQGKVIINYN